MFEAGAVAKHADSRVSTYLFGLEYSDVKDPLSQFQHTRATKEDTKKLVITLNRRLGEGGLSHERLPKAFDKWWPELEDRLKRVAPQSLPPSNPKDPMKKMLDMTTEILERVREQGREPSLDSSDVYDDDDRVSISSVVTSRLIEQLKPAGINFQAVGVCEDGAYAIISREKSWRVEKRIAEDCALGRMSLAEMLANSTQTKDPCQAERLQKPLPLPSRSINRKKNG